MTIRSNSLTSFSAEETFALGYRFGKTLRAPALLAFFGDLGTGKTTFIKGLIHAVTAIAPEEILSPTFVYMQPYANVYHFDLYRLSNCDEFCALGFEEYLHSSGICCIEWAERIEALLPPQTIRLTFQHVAEETRSLQISYPLPTG